MKEVRAQPANDLFANRLVLSGTNLLVSGTTIGATRENGEPYHAGVASGVASAWWSWTALSTNPVTISTSNSTFDTLLGVYTGSAVNALGVIASNDDDVDAGGYTSKVVFTPASNRTYAIAVDGYGGASGNVTLSVRQAPPSPLVPALAPAWTLPDPYGVLVSSSNYAGKVVLLDFWATWCGPCKVEMPDFVFLQNKYRADGLVIVGADVYGSGDTPQIVQTFLATNVPAINYQTIMGDAALSAAYGGIGAIPTTFIIDRQNLIRKKYVGTQTRSTFEAQIIPLLYETTRLSCAPNANQIVFTWPTNARAPFVLESAVSPGEPTWVTSAVAPTVVNGTNTLSVPMTNAGRCYRLRMSY